MADGWKNGYRGRGGVVEMEMENVCVSKGTFSSLLPPAPPLSSRLFAETVSQKEEKETFTPHVTPFDVDSNTRSLSLFSPFLPRIFSLAKIDSGVYASQRTAVIPLFVANKKKFAFRPTTVL